MFLFVSTSRLVLWRIYPPIQRTKGIRLPEPEAYQLPLISSSAKVKNAWSYSSFSSAAVFEAKAVPLHATKALGGEEV
jgi:hypothetical protein